MAGDELDVQAFSYYDGMPDDDVYATPEAMAESIMGALSGGIGGFEGGETPDDLDGMIGNLFGVDNMNAYDGIVAASTTPGVPRAYLNFLFFDESMKLDAGKTYAVQIDYGPQMWNHLQLPAPVEVTQNGYVVVYLSNSTHGSVFMDNVSIYHYQGTLIEEQHYYPHGLVMQPFNNNTNPKNKFLYQGKKMQDELGMQLYDFHARQYDPQIGRFWSLDPMHQFSSGYTGMGNNPAGMIDPTGMITQHTTGSMGVDERDHTPDERNYENALNLPEATTLGEMEDGKDKQNQENVTGQGHGNASPTVTLAEATVTAKKPSWFTRTWNKVRNFFRDNEVEFGTKINVSAGVQAGIETTTPGGVKIGAEGNALSVDLVTFESTMDGNGNQKVNVDYVGKNHYMNLKQGAKLGLAAVSFSAEREMMSAVEGGAFYNERINAEITTAGYGAKLVVPLGGVPASPLPSYGLTRSFEVGISSKFLVGVDIKIGIWWHKK